MKLISAIGAVILTSLISARADAAEPNELALHYIASEFFSVCVRTEADPEKIAAAAKERDWRKRPTEWSQFFGDRVDEAWDGDLSSIELLTGASLPKARFVVTRKTESGSPLCTFVFQGATKEALAIVLETQGMKEDGPYIWRTGKFDYQSTRYCLGDPSWAHADYQIEAYSGRIKGWPGGEAAYLTFRSSGGEKGKTGETDAEPAQCPIIYMRPEFAHARRPLAKPPQKRIEDPPPAPSGDAAEKPQLPSLGEGADPH